MDLIAEKNNIKPISKSLKSVSILGSTGSVGCQTIDLISRNPEAYEVVALTANRNIKLLVEQALRFSPKFVAIGDETLYSSLKSTLSNTDIKVGGGSDAIAEAAAYNTDWVMAAIVGSAGLKPILQAVRRGATIALANKECLVCAGQLLMDELARHKATLLPVDSEHNAIYQVFDFDRSDAVEKLILTASGGPFRNSSHEEMKMATPSAAVAHPNWDMGAKISVDSATMMNKGLEIIEAHHIFSMPEDRIDVVVHPQSVVHSMVSFVDGSILAQLGTPDMRIPIAYTLAWPSRIDTPSKRLNFDLIGSLEFEAPDTKKFPALNLAREALRKGSSATTVLNASNEIAVAAFLDGQIGFLDIMSLVEETLESSDSNVIKSIEDVFRLDELARDTATHLLKSKFLSKQ